MCYFPQMSGYIKCFENGRKNMSFEIKNDDVLNKYHEIWSKVKKTLNIKFHSMPIDDEKYIKLRLQNLMVSLKQTFYVMKY